MMGQDRDNGENRYVSYSIPNINLDLFETDYFTRAVTTIEETMKHMIWNETMTMESVHDGII